MPLKGITQLVKGQQLVKGRFFERLQNYMENECAGNENKIILEDFNITMDKMDRGGRNET